MAEAANHYDVLGVARTATADEITRAFRRRASEAHPDRHGGDDEEMARVNRAYEVLGDPERRRRYDESGDSNEPVPMEVRARGALIQIFAELLERDKLNIVSEARQVVRGVGDKLAARRVELTKRSERLARQRTKVRVKSGDNLVAQIIDAQIAGVAKELERVHHDEKMHQLVIGLLDAYEEDFEAPPGSLTVDINAALEAMLRAQQGRYPFGRPW